MTTTGHILIIDDTPDNLEMLARVLRRAGYRVDIAQSGRDAFPMLGQTPVDLILLDIAMPEMDGYAVCRQLKAVPQFKDIPVIFISAMENLIDKVHAFEVGGIDYITKPFQFAEVIARVRTHVELHQLRRQDQQLIADLSSEIAERKRAETRNRYLSELLQVVSDAIISTDKEFNIVSWNNAAEAIYGWREADVLGRGIDEVIAHSYVDTTEEKALAALMLDGHWEGEVLQRCQDGTLINIYSSVSIITDDDGQPTGAVAVNRDITERKQSAQHQLDLMIEREKATFLRDILANISHDIRTPLTVINTSLYLLERHTDPEQRHRKLTEIKIQASLLENIIQNLLTMSRLDTLPELRLAPTHIDQVLREVADKLQPTIEKKLIRFTLDTADGLPLISADSGQLYRVFINLVENALHYTEDEGAVTVRASSGEGEIIVEVIDTGIGIAPEDQARIFERFYRADKARQMDSAHAGTGLGLAIVRSIVEMHRGSIEVESVVGEGSTFRVMLPLA